MSIVDDLIENLVSGMQSTSTARSPSRWWTAASGSKIDTIGRDLNGTVVPRIHDFVTALIRELAQRPELALDIPVALNINVDELMVKVQPGTIKLDVVW